jgi:hypothetical protein
MAMGISFCSGYDMVADVVPAVSRVSRRKNCEDKTARTEKRSAKQKSGVQLNDRLLDLRDFGNARIN